MEGSEDLKDRRRCLSTLTVVLLQILFLFSATVECQNLTFAGFNITSTSSVADKGLRTIVLEDVALVDGWLVGYVATVSQGSCPFNLQLWNRTGFLSYQLIYEKTGISFIDPGQYQYDLGYSDYFYTSRDLKLGFTATSSSDTCVAYKSITDLSQRSQTFIYEFSTVPVVGSTYSFLPFQITRHYGIMAVLADAKPPRKTLYTLGFDTLRTTVLDSSKAKHAILLTGVNLIFGHLRSFTVKTNRNGCSVYLQIWSSVNDTTNSLALKYQSPLQKILVSGENVIPAHLSVILYPTDRIGFLDVSSTPCVVYEYNVLSIRFSDTGLLDFSGTPILSVGNTYDFLPFQRTHRFAVSIQVSTVIPPPKTGPKGKRGEIGKPGPSGPKGDIGESGDKGPSGIKGKIGDGGNTGLPGPVGNIGSDGPVGKSGDPGQKGDLGVPGTSGIEGKSGENGETGSVGSKGNAGTVTGEAGSSGDTGSPGSKGDIGSPGGRGDDGAPGITGGRGIRGSAGDKGTKGVTASNGLAGIKGFKGEQGMRGDMWDPKSKDWCRSPHCEHYCRNTGLGYVCSCREGYKLVTNSGNCMDINECAYDNGLCQYTCTNTVGSYKCSCPSGYNLAKDNHRCNDIDECTDGTNNCTSGEICINTWDGFVCLGSYAKSTLASTQVIDTSMVVTRSMFIGLLIWLVVVTLILLVEISFLTPEFLKEKNSGK